MGKLATERLANLDFNEARDDGVTVASAGPYANHAISLQTNKHATQFLQAGCSYFGVCTTCDGSSESEILRCIDIARKCVMLLEKHVWKSHIRVDTKVRLYQTYVLPVLMYGSEVWTITKALARRLDAFDTWVSPKNPSDPIYQTCHQRFCQADYRLLSSFQYNKKAPLLWPRGTFRSQARSSPSCQCVAPTTKRLEETSRAPAYHLAAVDSCPCTLYSQLTSVSNQPGGRPMIVFSVDISSTPQHSISGTPLKMPNQQCQNIEGTTLTDKPINKPQQIKNYLHKHK